jgi:hypothetical protein
MKAMTSRLIMLIFLLGLAPPAGAQSPAVLMTQGGSKECVKFSLKNLNPGPMGVGIVELKVFDRTSCKKLCERRIQVSQKIKSCQTWDGQICCPQKLPEAAAGYIYHLRVRSTSGILLTEDWMFTP